MKKLNTDRLEDISKLLQSIIENRCSFSDEDIDLLKEAVKLINDLKRSPPSNNKWVDDLTKIGNLLFKVFTNEDFQHLIDKF